VDEFASYGAPGNKEDFVPQNQPGPAAVAVGHGRKV